MYTQKSPNNNNSIDQSIHNFHSIIQPKFYIYIYMKGNKNCIIIHMKLQHNNKTESKTKNVDGKKSPKYTKINTRTRNNSGSKEYSL